MKKLISALCAAIMLFSCAYAMPGPVTGGCQKYTGYRDWKWPMHTDNCDISSCFIDIWDMEGVSTGTDDFVRKKGHFALDMTGGEKVYPAYEGVIFEVGNKCRHEMGCDCNGGFGNYVIIKHSYMASNNETGRDEVITVFSRYSHLAPDSVYSKAGQKVDTNTVIGITGSTGKTQGVHLDFCIMYTGNETWSYRDKYSIDPLMCEFFEDDVVPRIRLRCSQRSLACCKPYLKAVQNVYETKEEELADEWVVNW